MLFLCTLSLVKKTLFVKIAENFPYAFQVTRLVCPLYTVDSVIMLGGIRGKYAAVFVRFIKDT